MMSKKVLLLLLVGAIVMPVFVSAQNLNSPGYNGGTQSGGYPGGSASGGYNGGSASGGYNGGGNLCGVQGGTFVLCNPLAANNFCDLITAILNVVIALGVPIAVLFLVWSGFRFIFARGRPAELESAKKNFMYVIIGIAVFLGAWTLAKVISATIQQLDTSHVIKICSPS
jgi:hypothetical protein